MAVLLEDETRHGLAPGSALDRLGGFGPLSELRRRRFDADLAEVTRTHPLPELGRMLAPRVGLAELTAKNYEEAILAFKEVTVVHFQIREQAARATYYLVQAARGAAKETKGNAEAKAMYESMADEAKRSLETTYGDTDWAKKG